VQNTEGPYSLKAHKEKEREKSKVYVKKKKQHSGGGERGKSGQRPQEREKRGLAGIAE